MEQIVNPTLTQFIIINAKIQHIQIVILLYGLFMMTQKQGKLLHGICVKDSIWL